MAVHFLYTLVTSSSAPSLHDPVSKLIKSMENTESCSQAALDPALRPPLKWKKKGDMVKLLWKNRVTSSRAGSRARGGREKTTYFSTATAASS